MILDTHQHFWRYTPQEFGWLGDDMAGLQRDFLPGDLEPILRAHAVDGAIAVQARQSEVETNWLLQIADENSFVRGVVGWLSLIAVDIEAKLERAAGHPKLVGLRHVLQGEPDDYLQRDDFNRGVAALQRHDLAYDLLLFDRQLPAAIELVDRHPSVRFVLDHLGKPRIDTAEIEPWRAHLRELARRPNVSCKLSGGMTEIDPRWTIAKVWPCFDAAIEAFGPDRLMFGSNWPVCQAAGGYSAWLDAVQQWASALSAHERHQLFAATAINVYQLQPQPEARP